MKKGLWSASLICADILNFRENLQTLHNNHIDYFHVDVMDGAFVPRLGMYPEMVQKIKEVSSVPIEVHLMIQNPEPYISLFAEMGADILTVHIEACQSNLARILEKIASSNMKVGLALNPMSDFEKTEYFAQYIDFLLIMGFNPGIVGQKIKPYIFNKIKKYKDLFRVNNINTEIIIDGGVNFSNFQHLFNQGADILIGGSQTIFHSSQNITDNLLQLRNQTQRNESAV